MSVGKRDYLSRLENLLVLLILNGMAKMKLAILPILCCEEIEKTLFVKASKDNQQHGILKGSATIVTDPKQSY